MSTLITTTAQIGTIKDAGGNATAMTIDTSGRVFRSVTPHIFAVRRNAGGGGYETYQRYGTFFWWCINTSYRRLFF